ARFNYTQLFGQIQPFFNRAAFLNSCRKGVGMSSGTSISKKLAISFAALLLLTFVLSYNSLTVIRSLGSDLDKAVNSTGRAVAKVGDLASSLYEMKAAEGGFILFTSMNDLAQVERNKQDFGQAAASM